MSESEVTHWNWIKADELNPEVDAEPDEGERIDLGLAASGVGETGQKIQSDEVFKVYIALKDLEKHLSGWMSRMASRMKAKYDKYWGEIDKMNMIIYVAAILDPRKKLVFVEFCIRRMYYEDEASSLLKKVNEALNEIFADYKQHLCPQKASGSGNQTCRDYMDVDHMVMDDGEESAMDMFWKHEAESGKAENRSELDIFLQEEREKSVEFDVSGWWKLNSPRFPILSSIARDVLAVLVSTVASKSLGYLLVLAADFDGI
ncbi:hypothetical protein COLO4_23555 [Corchorus olitorius]|uniref:hAT-like transposase RNase-H fold domain-containing protein n=1 Tax=Corchorus olitorius TaxID=93759 RepID=A0A1R3IG01_9ROSI|nr:hypothetical protein COLO4_23555 [Corchorus olitorius]